MHIQIVETPPGEAPNEIRDKWVGVVIPLASPGPNEYRCTSGVLSGPKTALGMLFAWIFGKTQKEKGYLVDAYSAIELLNESSPEAANWWRENTEYGVKKGRCFLFAEEACKLIGER